MLVSNFIFLNRIISRGLSETRKVRISYNYLQETYDAEEIENEVGIGAYLSYQWYSGSEIVKLLME